MNLHDVISQLIDDTEPSIDVFLPELVLCLTIVLMLLVRVFNWGRRVDASLIALAGSATALGLATMATSDWPRMEIFTGMLVYDGFAVYMRSVLLLFVVLFTILTKLTGVPDREDGPDIYTLVLGATLGMCLMVSANHLLMVFMAVEMASVPCYALAGLMKGRRKASEAALKYAVYGAGAAGVMLYGISLIAGMTNSAHLPTIAAELATRTMSGDELMVLALGGLMVMVGLAFKLSAVPFHFWCPDVFEGATAEVDAFLSIASKAAALGLLVRVVIGFSVVVPQDISTEESTVAQNVSVEGTPAVGYFAVTDSLETPPPPENSHSETLASDQQSADAEARLELIQSFLGKLIALLAVVTCTFGNLAAYGQTNLKRLFAYSTIAHAGYMMMAIPPMLAMAQASPDLAEHAASALAVYIAVYLFMNLGAFTVVAFLRNEIRSEEIADCGGVRLL